MLSPNKVADAVDVAAGGVEIFKDSLLRAVLVVAVRELLPDGCQSECALAADEQVWVHAGGPGLLSVVQPAPQAGADRAGNGQIATVEGDPQVDDVAEFELLHWACVRGVEGDQSDGESDSHVVGFKARRMESVSSGSRTFFLRGQC
jgi:hypothetical protein